MPASARQREQAEELRKKAYLLHCRFYSQEQIAHTLGITQPLVSRYLKAMRDRDSTWWDQHNDPKSPGVRAMRAKAANQVADCINELWTQYNATDSEKPSSRASIIVQILGGLEQYHYVTGVLETSDKIWISEQTERITRNTEELKAEMQKADEKRMLDKVTPLPSGS